VHVPPPLEQLDDAMWNSWKPHLFIDHRSNEIDTPIKGLHFSHALYYWLQIHNGYIATPSLGIPNYCLSPRWDAVIEFARYP